MIRARLVVLAVVASCGARAPAPVDVDALVRARGPVEARRDLVIRVAGDPRDVAARLALATLDERLGRPADAIDQLEAVVALGGPLGVRWHDDDRARLARLIAARGRARLARGAETALADLERARTLGAAVGDAEIFGARAAGAIAVLRHSDAATRDGGRRTLAELSQRAQGSEGADRSGDTDAVLDGGGRSADLQAWLGARPGATAEQRGRFGAWLWAQGARRAAWDELAAWRAGAAPPYDRALEDAYLAAARWWTPLDRPSPPLAAVVAGPMRCALVPCAPRDVAGEDAAERAYLLAPLAPPVRDPADAAALVVITLHQALRGEAAWGAALAARVDLGAFAEPAQLAALPAFARPVFAVLAGREPSWPPPGAAATADQRLVLAASRLLDGGGADDLASLGDAGLYADALRAMVVLRLPFAGDARAEAVARHAARAVTAAADAATIAAAPMGAPHASSAATAAAVPIATAPIATAPIATAPIAVATVDVLRPIAAAFRREPAIADRLAGEAVAAAVDAAAMYAALGALFDALGDPARARAAWQAAVDASAEPAFLRGLAEAQARQGDGDAALVTATSAAAASGDPAVVWAAVAEALDGAGRHVHALEAARSAIDLAGPETLAAALDTAIAASRALGRTAQAEALAAQRARIAPAGGRLGDRDPSDGAAALDAHRRGASAATVGRLWLASRWNPRDVALRAALLDAITADDPRRAAIAGELVELAGSADRALGRAAAAALR